MEIAAINVKSLQKNIREVTDREATTSKTLIREKGKLAQMQIELEVMEKLCNKNQYLADRSTRELADMSELIPQKEDSIEKLLKDIADVHVRIDQISDEKFKANMVLASENAQRQAFDNVIKKHIDKEQTIKDKQEAVAAIKLLKMSDIAIKKKKSESNKTKDELVKKIKDRMKVREEKEQRHSELTNGMLPLRNRNRALMLRLRNQLKRSQEQKLEVSKRLDSLEQKLFEMQNSLEAIKNKKFP